MHKYQVVLVALVNATDEEEAKQKALSSRELLWTVKTEPVHTSWEQEAAKHPLYPNPEKSLW